MDGKHTVGKLAEIKNINAQTLRYYDRIGIFSPQITSSDTGYRYYAAEQFIEVDHIRFLKLLGFTLDEIKSFRKEKNLKEAVGILKQKHHEFTQQLQRLQSISENFENIIEEIDSLQSGRMDSKRPEIVEAYGVFGIISEEGAVKNLYDFELQLQKLMGKYPDYEEIGHNYGLLHVFDSGYISDLSDGHLKFFILPVRENDRKNRNVRQYRIDKHIRAYHRGPRRSIGKKLQELKTYAESQGLKIKDEIIVSSIAGSFIVNNSEEHITEIKIPVETNIS